MLLKVSVVFQVVSLVADHITAIAAVYDRVADVKTWQVRPSTYSRARMLLLNSTHLRNAAQMFKIRNPVRLSILAYFWGSWVLGTRIMTPIIYLV